MSHGHAASADRRINGVVVGLVVDVFDPDEIGRVKIRLPWFASGYEEWARVAQPYAGNGYGSTWIPEVDGEVLVAFAHGDMRWPYIIGCLHGAIDAPPVSRSASTDVRTLRTPAGSELTFDEGNGVIDLKTPNGASIRLDEQSGSITLKATDKLELSAKTVEITGSDQVTLKGGQIALN